jgi:type I restriction enzyme S subunit
MKSNYKKLGEFIEQVKVDNNDGIDRKLLGVNLDKEFIPSVANIVGTDMESYSVIKKGQFGCKLMSVGRDKRVPISLLNDYDEAIISSAYYVFEIIDREKLLNDYLMMWLSRPESDRYLWFISGSDVRGGISWDDFCTLPIVVPEIDKQKEIVKEYHIIINRNKLNEQIIQKLEETAQSIYRQWFVDFEFPDEDGKPYKSNGGEMVWDDVLESEIPSKWKVICVKDFCSDMKSGGTPSRDNPDYWNSNDIPWLKTGEIGNNIVIETEEFISHEGLKNSSAKLLPKGTVLMSMYGVNAGDIGILRVESTTNQACCGMICKNDSDAAFLYYQLLINQDFHSRQSIGGAQENLSKDYIERISFLLPDNDLIDRCNLRVIVDNRELLTREIKLLNNTLQLLLSKITLADHA